MIRTESHHTIKLSEIDPELAAKVREARKEEAAKAEIEGYIEAKAQPDARELLHAFDHNCPHKMAGYGDPGHLLPAWRKGFNTGAREVLGIAHAPDEETVRDARNGWFRDRRIATFEEAIIVADKLTEQFGMVFLPEDRGSNVSPRFGIFRAFRVGEPVSYGFNGDFYPAGVITAISKSGRVITTKNPCTSTEKKFYRRKLTASWKHNGMWTLVSGFHREQNPHI